MAGLTLTATPAQHFSGRSLFDGNSTLWASWVIVDDDLRVFFSGDTGYFDGFRTIGERLGPFDVTLIETGAYDAQWPYVHMQPEETVQAHIDLRGRWLVPIHNGTFDLAMHRWQEPFERVTALAIVRGVDLSTPWDASASHSTNRIAASGGGARSTSARRPLPRNRAAGRFARRRPRSKTHRSLSIFPGARQCRDSGRRVAGVPARRRAVCDPIT